MNIAVAVRIVVGLALVIVAHQVLLKKSQTSELIQSNKKTQRKSNVDVAISKNPNFLLLLPLINNISLFFVYFFHYDLYHETNRSVMSNHFWLFIRPMDCR